MPENAKIRRYKYKNIAAALAVLLLIMVGINTSCSASLSKRRAIKDKTNAADTSSVDKKSDKKDGGTRLTKNYVYKQMQNGTSLNNGLLLQVDADHPFTGQVANAESLYSFLFTDSGEQVMSASYPSDEALPEMLKNLNAMAVAFADETGLNTLMVSSMIPDDGESQKKSEAYIGSCADLMLYDHYTGEYGEFTGEDKYVWIKNNCYKFGFVFRGTNRLRYVGKEAAACIRFMSQSEGSADLEKLQTVIKDYTFEKPMFFTGDDAAEYAGYFVAAENDTTTTGIPIPTRDDESEYSHFISGNNVDGYIVFVDMSENAEFDSYYESTDKPSEDTAGE